MIHLQVSFRIPVGLLWSGVALATQTSVVYPPAGSRPKEGDKHPARLYVPNKV